MSEHLRLTPDELLTTTRAVRKRLDFTRPVERTVLEECLTIAQQAPTGSNIQNWHFVVVTDPAKRRAFADVYRSGCEHGDWRLAGRILLPRRIANFPVDLLATGSSGHSC